MMRRLLQISILVLLLPLQLFAAAGNGTVVEGDSVARARAFDYFYIQAISLREAEKYDEAFDMLEHCLALQPSSPIVQYELYSMYCYLGRKEEALAMIENASLGDPGNYWYRTMLADAYYDSGNRSKALEVYEAMARDFSSHSEIYSILFQMYAEEKEYVKAIEALDNVERIEGKNEQLTLQKCRIYTMMEKLDLVISEIQELIDEYPDEPRLKMYLGSAYEMFDDRESAFQIYREVLADDPQNVSAQASIAEYYDNAGNDSLCNQMVESMLMNDRLTGERRTELLVRHLALMDRADSIEYNIRLLDMLMAIPHERVATAEVYVDYLRTKEAPHDSLIPLYREILQLEPENQKAQLGLLQIAIEREDYDEVIVRCDTAIMYNPEMLELYYYKGLSCYNVNRMHEAIAAFEAGLEKRGEGYDGEFISDIYALVGDIHHAVGNWDECSLAYDSALVYNESNVGALNNYAYYLAVEGGNLDKAEEMSLATIKKEPENSTYLDTYMWILFCKERYQEAKAYAGKLLDIEGDDADKVLLHHCGDIYAMCGEVDRAVELWQRAQAAGDDSKLLKKKIKKRKYYADKKKKR